MLSCTHPSRFSLDIRLFRTTKNQKVRKPLYHSLRTDVVAAKDLLMFAKQHLPFLFGTAVSFPRNVFHPATGKEEAK